MTEEHILALAKLCRVCGRASAKFGKAVRKYQCSKHQPDLETTFRIDISKDDPCLHPPSFCHPCKNIIYSTKKAIEDKKEFTPTKIIHQWEAHREVGCTMCSHAPKVGRPKKIVKPGRPQRISFKSAIQHIKSVAPDSHTTMEHVVLTDLLPESKCPLCLSLLDQPVELTTCESYVCAECCCTWLRSLEQQSLSLSCPCCYPDHMSDYGSIKKPPDILLGVLANLQVMCRLCRLKGLLKDHSQHLKSKCQTLFSQPETISEVLNKSRDSPLSPIEEKLQTSLVRRSMSSSTSPTLQVKTKGQVSYM